jgi:hypothetical protein
MATQTRVPGAASSEVDFELERFERTADDRIEIAGRWFGLRGRRFVRPVLNLNSGGSRRRAIALLEHKPWAAEDGEVWLAAFRWPEGTGEVSGAELEVGPGLLVELPALGGKSGAEVHVTALRPHVTAAQPAGEEEPADEPAARVPAHPRREPGGRAAAPDWTDAPPREGPGRAGAPEWTDAPPRERSGRAARDRSDALREHEGRSARDRSDGLREREGRASRDRSDALREREGRAARDRSDEPARERPGAPLREGAGGGAGVRRLEESAGAPVWTDAPPRERSAPPRDVLTTALAERDEAVASRETAERERVAALQDRDDALSRRDAALRDADRAVAERDEAFAERDRIKAELERVTRERDIAHAERKRTLQDAEAVTLERDQAGAERDAARSELSRALPARDEAIRERDAQSARAEQAERERDTAFAERKSAVAQRDRARRERDRAMRAAGVEPPEESPYVAPAPVRAEAPRPDAATAPPTLPDAAPPGTPLPSRPLRRIGAAPAGPGPEQKPLLTPVDAGGRRRLSRTRRPPSAPARWAVRVTVILLMIAIAVVLVILLSRVV